MKKELKFKKKKINEILINKDSKRIPVSKLERQKRKGKYPYYGAAGIIDYVNDWIFEGKHLLIAEDGSVLTKQNKPVLQLVDGKFWVNNHAHVLTCKDESDLNYIFYALKNINISSLITGSVQLKLNQDNLNKIEVPYLENKEQRKNIGLNLKRFDLKIEYNQIINHTINEITELLFKSWFINFETTSSGTIPKDWVKGCIGDLVIRSKEKIGNNPNKVLTAKSSGKLLLSSEYFSKQVFSKNTQNYLRVNKFDFAYNPSRINIGSIGMSEFNFLGSVSPVYIVFSAKKNWHFFINQFIRLPSSKSKIAQLCSGSVRQSLSFEDFSSIPLLIPNEKIILKYNNVIELFRQKIKNISKENILHAELRDLIVNKIFSGDYQTDSKFK